MHAWEQIQKTVDYMEEHLAEAFDIESLAELASLSPFYYQRLFKRLVKKPVMEYVKLRRMARAADLLLEGGRILDVALELGYSSHEQFTRTFKETFGLTPDAYRKHPTAFNRMTKPELLLHYTLVDENVPLITEGIVLEVSRRRLEEPQRFTGFSAEAPVGLVEALGVESGEDPLYELWESFHRYRNDIPGLIPGGDDVGVAYPGDSPGSFRYFAGAQSNIAGAEPGHAAPGCDGSEPGTQPGHAAPGCDGTEPSTQPGNTAPGYGGTELGAEPGAAEVHGLPLETWELAAGEYIVCTFSAENFNSLVMDALYKAQRYLFSTWLPNHGLCTEPFSAERYERHDASATTMELWVKPLPLSVTTADGTK